MNYNKVILVGNLTRDPELRHTASGAAVASFGLAINRRWTGKDGQSRDETLFVDVDAWQRQAEVIAEHVHKGDGILVEGRLKLDEWEKDGQKRSQLKVTLERFEFMPRGNGDERPPQPAPQSQPAATPAATRENAQSGTATGEVPF